MEAKIDTNPEDVGLSSLLNEERRAAYDEIMSTVDIEQGGLFFVDGLGSTGKTCIELFSEPFAVRTSLSLLQLHLVLQYL
jgi:hypothetical protein